MNKEDNNNTLQQQKDNEITKINRQADVLDQTRLRPHCTILRYNCEGKIVNLLLNLQSRDKADLTVSLCSSVKKMNSIQQQEKASAKIEAHRAGL
jgi:hypothetical protein